LPHHSTKRATTVARDGRHEETMSIAAGDALTLELDRGFVIASGIECSAPLIEGGIRQDELSKTGHDESVEADLALVAEFGIRYLRYGIPFHVVAADPGRLDWRWTDRAMSALQANGIEPIVDLLHFGLPDDLWGFGDPGLPSRFASFAERFADRYPWVRYYTPVNEPLISARFSAQLGWWNERRTDDESFVAAIDGAATCAVLAMAAIRARRPDAVFVQSDTCEGFEPAVPEARQQAQYLNELRFVAWDLTYGRRPGELVTAWLRANGMGEERIAWYVENGSSENCIVGHDFYAGNEWRIRADGSAVLRDDPRGYAAQARDYHAHFGLPFMLSETNMDGPAAEAWLATIWNDALVLRDEGLPIRGVCWYGFIDHVDWDTALREVNDRPNACGLVDLDRRPHPVGERYRALARAGLDGVLDPFPAAPEPRPLASHRAAPARRDDAHGGAGIG
jgi:beta-glucosidase